MTLTVQVLDDVVEAFMLSDLSNNLSDGVCESHTCLARFRGARHQAHVLNTTPIKVKMTNLDMTKKAK